MRPISIFMNVVIALALCAILYEKGAHWGTYLGLALLTYDAIKGA